MKKFYVEIEAEFVAFQSEEVILASTPDIGNHEHYIGGENGIGNI